MLTYINKITNKTQRLLSMIFQSEVFQWSKTGSPFPSREFTGLQYGLLYCHVCKTFMNLVDWIGTITRTRDQNRKEERCDRLFCGTGVRGGAKELNCKSEVLAVNGNFLFFRERQDNTFNWKFKVLPENGNFSFWGRRVNHQAATSNC